MDEFLATLVTLAGCFAAVTVFGVVFYWLPVLLGVPAYGAGALLLVAGVVALAALETWG